MRKRKKCKDSPYYKKRSLSPYIFCGKVERKNADKQDVRDYERFGTSDVPSYYKLPKNIDVGKIFRKGRKLVT